MSFMKSGKCQLSFVNGDICQLSFVKGEYVIYKEWQMSVIICER